MPEEKLNSYGEAACGHYLEQYRPRIDSAARTFV